MSKKNVPKESTDAPPFQSASPAGIDVPRYIRRIKEGKFDEAFEMVNGMVAG